MHGKEISGHQTVMQCLNETMGKVRKHWNFNSLKHFFYVIWHILSDGRVEIFRQQKAVFELISAN